MPFDPAVPLPEDDSSQTSAHICIKRGETSTSFPVLLTSAYSLLFLQRISFSEIHFICMSNSHTSYQKHRYMCGVSRLKQMLNIFLNRNRGLRYLHHMKPKLCQQVSYSLSTGEHLLFIESVWLSFRSHTPTSS